MKQYLPFELKGGRFRAKVPILAYTPNIGKITPSAPYYPIGTICIFKGACNYGESLSRWLLRELRQRFAVKAPYHWYDLILEVEESKAVISVDSTSLFALFDPIDENGNVIEI